MGINLDQLIKHSISKEYFLTKLLLKNQYQLKNLKPLLIMVNNTTVNNSSKVKNLIKGILKLNIKKYYGRTKKKNTKYNF